jgi:two-component system KDP operon response regulator KdpE
MSNARILVVDDEPQIRRYLKTILAAQGYELALAETGRAAIEQVAAWRPDVVLLDLGLPDLEGAEVCRRVREWSDVPIIVLSARDREDDKVAALDMGADDYLTKPFGSGELLARIGAALRHAARQATPEQPLIVGGELQLNLATREVTRGGEPIHLTPTEYAILKVLATSGGRILTHEMLLQQVWGGSGEADAAKLRVFVNQLRRKVEADPARPHHILTETGVGYRFRMGDS